MPDKSAHPEQALPFGRAAALYDRVRPPYPPDAVRWAIGDPPARVVDLGAGTGILTRALLAAGFDVVPVEPDEGMRAQLAAATPGTVALAGSAEAIPLPDGCVDAVVAGQAYHWFDRDRAHPEIARVLRPGGMFAPVWNVRDESVAWVAELGRIASMAEQTHHAAERVDSFGPHFGPVRRAEFRHSVTQTPDGLVELVKSRSHYLTASPHRQAEMEAAVRDLARRLGPTFELPYVTVAYRATRL